MDVNRVSDPHGLGWLPATVVDTKLTAGRGIEFTNAYIQRKALGDSLFEGEEEEDDSSEEIHRSTLDTFIPEENKGYQMLLKMGWKAGKGLGRLEDGIVEPVRSGVEEGMRLGLGKQEQDTFFTSSDNVQRKKLETEIQADEGDERRDRREAMAEREAKIKLEVTEILRTFLCEICSKQYTTAMELDQHLSSYDHHHKKRLIEMRAMEQERTKGDRFKKESKNASREMARLQKQIEKAAAERGGPPPLPPGPPPCENPDVEQLATLSSVPLIPVNLAIDPAPPPPPPPEGGFGISFGLSLKSGAIRGRGGITYGLARGGMAAQGAGRGGGRSTASAAPAAGAFGISDSEDEEGG